MDRTGDIGAPKLYDHTGTLNWDFQRPTVRETNKALDGMYVGRINTQDATLISETDRESYLNAFERLGYDKTRLSHHLDRNISRFEYNGQKFVTLRTLYQTHLTTTQVFKESNILKLLDPATQQDPIEVDAILLSNDKEQTIDLFDLIPVERQRGFHLSVETTRFNPRIEKHLLSERHIYVPPIGMQKILPAFEGTDYEMMQSHDLLFSLHEISHDLLNHFSQPSKETIAKEREVLRLTTTLYSSLKKMGFDIAPDKSFDQIKRDLLLVSYSTYTERGSEEHNQVISEILRELDE